MSQPVSPSDLLAFLVKSRVVAVPLPEIASDAITYVRRLKVRDFDTITQAETLPTGQRTAVLLALYAADEHGQPLFTPEQAAQLVEADAELAQRLITAGGELNNPPQDAPGEPQGKD